MNIKLPLSIAAGVLAAAAALCVQAQTAPPRTVNRDELRVCMNNDAGLAARRKAYEAQSRKIGEESAAIRSEQEELANEQKRLEEDNKPMDRFQRKVRAHNERVRAARAAAGHSRKDLDALNADVVAHNADCGRVSFQPEDREAILKEQAGGK